MVSTVEKYALEIEIFTLSRGFPGSISRSGAQKRRFQRSVCGQSGRTDFFNRIGRFVPVTIDIEQPELTMKVAYETRGDSLVLLGRGPREGAGQKSGAFASKTAPEDLSS
jgi:hypothetical protein